MNPNWHMSHLAALSAFLIVLHISISHNLKKYTFAINADRRFPYENSYCCKCKLLWCAMRIYAFPCGLGSYRYKTFIKYDTWRQKVISNIAYHNHRKQNNNGYLLSKWNLLLSGQSVNGGYYQWNNAWNVTVTQTFWSTRPTKNTKLEKNGTCSGRGIVKDGAYQLIHTHICSRFFISKDLKHNQLVLSNKSFYYNLLKKKHSPQEVEKGSMSTSMSSMMWLSI